MNCNVNLSGGRSVKESKAELRGKDEAKRSKGVTVFGVLIIVGSVLSLLSTLGGWKNNSPISNYLYLILTPLLIVIAVFLLKLKNWARLAIIIFVAIVLVETLITSPYTLSQVKKYDMSAFEKVFYASIELKKQQAKPDAPQLTNEQIEEARQKAVKVGIKSMEAMLLIMIILSAIFSGLLIYFFTRPKIKEQFN